MREMKRPWGIWVVAMLYLGVGLFTAEQAVAALLMHREANIASGVLGLVAIVAAAYLPLGANWARWLALGWMGFHVAISYRVLSEMLAHLAIFAGIAVLLFLPSSRRFFAAKEAA